MGGRILAVAGLGAWLSLGAAAQGANYRLDASRSTVTFSIRHLLLHTVTGTMGGLEGKIYYDPARPQDDRVEAQLRPATLSTGLEARDHDLAGANYFDAAHFPAIEFRSTGVRAGGGGLIVEGLLRMHGVERPISIQVAKIERQSGGELRVVGQATLHRADFGITHDSTLIGNPVKVTLDLRLAPAPGS